MSDCNCIDTFCQRVNQNINLWIGKCQRSNLNKVDLKLKYSVVQMVLKVVTAPE